MSRLVTLKGFAQLIDTRKNRIREEKIRGNPALITSRYGFMNEVNLILYDKHQVMTVNILMYPAQPICECRYVPNVVDVVRGRSTLSKYELGCFYCPCQRKQRLEFSRLPQPRSFSHHLTTQNHLVKCPVLRL